MMKSFYYATVAAALFGGMTTAASAEELRSLAGTWVMESAYEIKADGTRTTNYSEHPWGLLMVDRAGRYNLQIFRPGRRAFAKDKVNATLEELREAVVGSSTHYGRVKIDSAKHQLLFDVEAASLPNWEGKRQIRDYTFEKGVLSYSVPASASSNGTVAYSIWRRVER